MIRTRAPRAVAALALALVLPLGLVACSDADDSAEVVGEGSSAETTEASGGSDDEGSTTTEGSDESTTTEGSDDSTTTEGGGGEASGDLVDALLTADDLPPGHAQDGEDVTDGSTMSDTEPLCPGETATFPSPVEEAEREFQTEDLTSLVGSFAGRFSGDDAETGLAFYRSELERCAGTADDLSYEYRDLTGIGDEALEITLSDPADPESGTATVYFARVDDVLVGVSVFAEDPAAIDGEALLALSADRV